MRCWSSCTVRTHYVPVAVRELGEVGSGPLIFTDCASIFVADRTAPTLSSSYTLSQNQMFRQILCCSIDCSRVLCISYKSFRIINMTFCSTELLYRRVAEHYSELSSEQTKCSAARYSRVVRTLYFRNGVIRLPSPPPLGAIAPQWALASSSFTRFLDDTQRHTTVGRTPLDE